MLFGYPTSEYTPNVIFLLEAKYHEKCDPAVCCCYKKYSKLWKLKILRSELYNMVETFWHLILNIQKLLGNEIILTKKCFVTCGGWQHEKNQSDRSQDATNIYLAFYLPSN